MKKVTSDVIKGYFYQIPEKSRNRCNRTKKDSLLQVMWIQSWNAYIKRSASIPSSIFAQVLHLRVIVSGQRIRNKETLFFSYYLFATLNKMSTAINTPNIKLLFSTTIITKEKHYSLHYYSQHNVHYGFQKRKKYRSSFLVQLAKYFYISF